jgi:hypothetical protein
MKRIENRCCDCATPGYPCRGSACPLTHLEVHYCDKCGDELDEIYDVDGVELCEYHLKEMFRRDYDG